jgi:magnesium-transporting ATPase (P-type)
MSAYHSEEIEPILSSLGTSLKGIKKEEVLERRKKYGENKLQEKKHKSI